MKCSWVFKTDFKDWIKYFLNKWSSSKYVIKGQCRQCGQCCLNILFSDENGYIKTKEGFEKLQKRKYFYKQFFIAGKVKEDDISKDALLFGCKYLKNNKCSKYFFRPLFCRDYPAINNDFIYYGGETLDNCGFYFDVNKKFSTYLK
jgi:Fe-S-cluster containining protein